MANQDLLKLGRVTVGAGGSFEVFPGGTESNSFIRVTATFTAGSTDVVVTAPKTGYYGIEYFRPGFLLRKTGQGWTNNVTKVISVNLGTNTIEIEDEAGVDASGTTYGRISKGMSFIQSGSLVTPSGYPVWRYTSVTGSQDSEYNTDYPKWATLIPLALTSSDSNTVSSAYGVYDISEITDRISNNLSSFYISASVSYPEAPDYTPSSGILSFAISETTLTSSIAPLFGGGDIGVLEGLGFAASQNQTQFLSQTTTFPYTGSAEISGSLAVTGSNTFLLNNGNEFKINSIKGTSLDLLNVNGDTNVINFHAYGNTDTKPTAVLGGIYFTSASLFIGIE